MTQVTDVVVAQDSRARGSKRETARRHVCDGRCVERAGTGAHRQRLANDVLGIRGGDADGRFAAGPSLFSRAALASRVARMATAIGTSANGQ